MRQLRDKIETSVRRSENVRTDIALPPQWPVAAPAAIIGHRSNDCHPDPNPPMVRLDSSRARPGRGPLLEEGVETIRVVCAHDCPDMCSLLARVENGRIVRIDGDPDQPFTAGFACAKV